MFIFGSESDGSSPITEDSRSVKIDDSNIAFVISNPAYERETEILFLGPYSEHFSKKWATYFAGLSEDQQYNDVYENLGEWISQLS